MVVVSWRIMRRFVPGSVFVLACGFSSTSLCSAQTVVSGTEDLTPEQQVQFKDAQTDFAAERWDPACAKLQILHAAVPGNLVLIKFEAEAEINGGKATEAIALLQPVLASTPEDVQALAITAQPIFQKEHPAEAAKGERRFSMDGYSEQQHGPNGTATQTHATYGFFDGRPTYDTFRDRALTIAQGQSSLVSGASGTLTPAPKQ